VLRTFSELFAEGMAMVNAAIRERDNGNVVFEPKLPPPIITTDTNTNHEETLELLMEYWLTQKKKSRTSKAEAILIIKKFKSMVGDIKPSEVTRRHVAELKDRMLEAKLAPATINKGRGILAAIFSTAVKNGRLEKNPFFNMEKLEVPESEEESPYDIEELQTIFDSPVFTQGYRPKRFAGEASFWLPLLSLYTAGRLNELGQLYTEDIKLEGNIQHIIIKPDSATGRTTKDNKKRRVPFHADLIKMGFLEYVAKIKSEGHVQLFPELKVTREGGKLADKWSSWWSDYVRTELKITRIPSPFHAFRHTFTEYGRNSNMGYESRMRIEGHSMNTVGDKKYGRKLFPLEPLYEELQKLTFRGLDLSHLYKS